MSSQSHATEGPVRGGYWPSFGDLPVADIDTQYFTHIYYAFAGLEPGTFHIRIQYPDRAHLFVDTLKNRSPPVKTLLSIGDMGNEITAVFAAMASTKQSRAAFITSTLQAAREYGFDGFDFDWEFPQNQQEFANYASLLEEWHQALETEAQASGKPRLLLTASAFHTPTIDDEHGPRSYPARAVRDYLDWVHLICHNYHGAGETVTAHNANLIPTTKDGVEAWIASGVPPTKLLLSLPLFGKQWTLRDPNVHGVGAPAYIKQDQDTYTHYSAIVEFNKQNGATVVYDEAAVAYYSYAGTAWISYDDKKSITRRVQYAKQQGLKGYFYWAIGWEDKSWTLTKQATNAWGN